MKFGPFLLLGWFRIVCHTCHSTLILKSVGERCWVVLAAGVVVTGAIWYYLDVPFRIIGGRFTLVLFIAVIITTVFFSMYYAWKDSRFELSAHS